MNNNAQSYELGKLLNELRPNYHRGTWLALLRRLSIAFNRPLSQPTAWRHMKFAQLVDQGKAKVTR